MAVPYTTDEQQASVSLRFVIVGGSIAGLSAAYALRKAGHDVLVLEQSDGNTRSLGGIRSPPNMTRILNQWGLRPSLDKVAIRCTQVDFRRGETGEILGRMKLHEQFFQDLRADFLFLQHADLHTILLDLATQAGANIRYNSKVTRADSETVTVTLEGGETLSADVVIGADGCNSLIRSAVLNSVVPETPDKFFSLTGTVSTDLMREDEELRPLTETSDWTLWLGNGYFVHGTLIRARQLYSVCVCVPAGVNSPTFGDCWYTHCQIEELGIDFEQFEPRIRKLLKLAKTAIPTGRVVQAPFESSVCDRARVCLIGDAAHPMMPNGAHNAAMSIEDAVTLGKLFSRIQHASQLPRILAAYEEIRQPRCNATQDFEQRRRHLYSLPYGPEQEARDELLRETTSRTSVDWEEMDEGFFKMKWEDEVELFGHDAGEKVEDWWTKWGSLLDRERRECTGSHPLSPAVEVSISRDGRVST